MTDVNADEITEIANKLWERWDTGTRAWLEGVGSWRRLSKDEEEFDPELGEQRYAAVSLGGYVDVRSSTLAGVDLIGFHVVVDETAGADAIATEGAKALDAAIIGRADMIVRTAGHTEPSGLASATGGLTVNAHREEDGLHIVARMPIAMAMPVAPGALVELPPALTAEPEVPITPARDDVPASLVTEPEPEVEVESEPEVEVHGDQPLPVAATTAAEKPKKAAAKKATEKA